MSDKRTPGESLLKLNELFNFAREDPLDVRLAGVVTLAGEALPTAHHTSITIGDVPPDLPVCSDGIAEALDETQYEAGDGPCIDAFRNGEPVGAMNLAVEERWPRFTEEARRSGVYSSLALPLCAQDRVLGALNLYSEEIEGFDEGDVEIATLIACRAAVGLANAELLNEARALEHQLREALTSRDIIGQAKGILMASEGCSDDEAFRMLVTASQHSNRKLREIAQAIIDEHNNHLSRP